MLEEAYGSPEARAGVIESLRKVRSLLAELGLITPASVRLWKAFGIWDAPAAT